MYKIAQQQLEALQFHLQIATRILESQAQNEYIQSARAELDNISQVIIEIESSKIP